MNPHSRTFRRLAWLPLAVLCLAPLHAQEDPAVAAVRQADDARLAAMLRGAAGRDTFESLFSDDLQYRHSSGAVDTKASYIAALTSGHTRYTSNPVEKRRFLVAAPGIVLVTGTLRMNFIRDGAANSLHLNFLEVWRKEGGAWRFLAWQSCALAK